MKKLEGKNAIITGGTSGIGLATARLFLSEGAKVIVTGSSAESVAVAQKELPGAIVLRSNAASLADIDALAREADARFGGRVDVVFLNAGGGTFEPATTVTEERFDRQFDLNVKGPFFAIQKLLPLLADGASVIVTTTVTTQKGWAYTSVYSAAKAALGSFVRTLATELGPRKIRVNAVSPGPIDTPIFGKLGLPQEAADGFATKILGLSPAARFGRPDEVGNAVLFLASDAASYVSGTEIVVDANIVHA